ncbi:MULTISPECIES: acyl-CoA carboxylase subunit epsilon [Streptomyces]|uniref:Predicted protein n=1 Tax=Streptomyces viridosporus (strain ATCC 14672 / DSM 40746 / JCM 4963 / KCTC 9882 / NRRL B-12104 / FH 1290) TaxID=566461 RepID=D6AAS5_STRV1|nr:MULTISPECIES: acyl-CoA carboxylase subunit epsilon [Streptomyces]EFE72610.1 predicted protein [Streptomyces viridosporus ATCC 14672]PWJ04692.1 acyl-CoA carboxylase subunit epsilon [Streptomyces sp. NWU49]
MDSRNEARLLLRVERGAPDDDELAAVTVALLSALAARDEADATEDRELASWQRPERTVAYRVPHSWK